MMKATPRYNADLVVLAKAARPYSEEELSAITARLGDKRESARWAEAANTKPEAHRCEEPLAMEQLRVSCAWCRCVLHHGPPDRVSHGICLACLKKEMEQ